jgi:glucose/arabinose dehydrogenase
VRFKLKRAKVVFLIIILFVALIFGFILIFWFNGDSQSDDLSIYGVVNAFPNLSFNRPVGIYFDGGEIDRLFVVSQRGEIYVFENSEAVGTATVFLDIKDRVLFGGEQGLLGLAFHPNFSINGFFYVNYVASNPRRTVISRFSVVDGFSDVDSELVLLEVLQPHDIHNGGQIGFGPDGYLYVAFGDGGPGEDPLGNGQNLSTLLSSIARIDVNSASQGRNYGIPVDNPFVGNTQGYREEIFAYGLRNPWRFSFDFVTGQLWVGDVGQRRIEEIDLVEKGRNYGWNIMEGSLCFSPSSDCDPNGLEQPIWEYGRDFGISITGGFVYRGIKFGELFGTYVYGDFGSGKIWGFTYDGVAEGVNIELVDTDLNIVSFGIDKENELHIVALDGNIYKLTLKDSAPP